MADTFENVQANIDSANAQWKWIPGDQLKMIHHLQSAYNNFLVNDVAAMAQDRDHSNDHTHPPTVTYPPTSS